VSEPGKDFQVGKVICKYGMTLNLGNYESFRADAEMEVVANKQCKNEEEVEILKDEMYLYGWNAVKDELKKQVAAVRKANKLEEGK
jgi:hypothetical protein